MSVHKPCLLSLAVFVIAVAAVAFVGAQFTPGPWYEALRKPSFNPPDWVFAPVWAVLYVMVALAGWRLWCGLRAQGTWLLSLYALQLGLNAAWSWLFFGLQRPAWALVDIVALWLVIVILVAGSFARRQRLAAWLLLPYTVWVGFAAVLNVAIWRLNSA